MCAASPLVRNPHSVHNPHSVRNLHSGPPPGAQSAIPTARIPTAQSAVCCLQHPPKAAQACAVLAADFPVGLAAGLAVGLAVSLVVGLARGWPRGWGRHRISELLHRICGAAPLAAAWEAGPRKTAARQHWKSFATQAAIQHPPQDAAGRKRMRLREAGRG